MDVAESASFTDRSHPAVSGSSIESLTVAAEQDRAFVAFTNGEVDRAASARNERDHCGLVALADNPQCAVAALERKVLDVRRTCLGHAQAVEAEQHSERGVSAVVAFGGEQEAAEFTAIHGVLFGRFDLGT
jgi:hypothetical protein